MSEPNPFLHWTAAELNDLRWQLTKRLDEADGKVPIPVIARMEVQFFRFMGFYRGHWSQRR